MENQPLYNHKNSENSNKIIQEFYSNTNVTFNFHDAYHIMKSKDWIWIEKEKIAYSRLVIVFSGCGYIFIDDIKYDVIPGRIFFIQKDSKLSGYQKENSYIDIINLYINTFNNDGSFFMLKQNYFVFDVKNISNYISLFNNIFIIRKRKKVFQITKKL